VNRPQFCADPSVWFHVEAVGSGVHLISEPGHVNNYLITGADRALLFDSGTGISSISTIVASLTELPVTVVSSHHHIDHRGGNADLATGAVNVAEFAAHPAAFDPDGECAHRAGDREFLIAYAEAMRDLANIYDEYTRLDTQHFFAMARHPQMRAIPDLDAWRVQAVAPTRALADGERIDLGGRVLTVLHAAGHTPDHLCLFDEATGILFSGDAILAAAHWLHGPGADLEQFRLSAERMSGLPVTRILPAHNLITELGPQAAREVADAAAAVAAEAASGYLSTDLLGHPVTRHDHGPVTILTPALAEPTIERV
jgi:glyoxylase-like metal-dependent hydrolase (beta-lactamase superfamily II)